MLGAPGHLRRRARLGALLPDGVRWPSLGHAVASGAAHGLVAAGYKAIDSLRLEKGYRVWGADITPEESPFEAGLGFAVKLDKEAFVGRDALLARQQPDVRLCCLTLAHPPPSRSARSRYGRGDQARWPRHERWTTDTRSSARSPTRTCPRWTWPGHARQRSRSGEWAGRGRRGAILPPAGERIRSLGAYAGGRSAANQSVISSVSVRSRLVGGAPAGTSGAAPLAGLVEHAAPQQHPFQVRRRDFVPERSDVSGAARQG